MNKTLGEMFAENLWAIFVLVGAWVLSVLVQLAVQRMVNKQMKDDFGSLQESLSADIARVKAENDARHEDQVEGGKELSRRVSECERDVAVVNTKLDSAIQHISQQLSQANEQLKQIHGKLFDNS